MTILRDTSYSFGGTLRRTPISVKADSFGFLAWSARLPGIALRLTASAPITLGNWSGWTPRRIRVEAASRRKGR